MIDKYKRPRVQRLVPWRASDAEVYAARPEAQERLRGALRYFNFTFAKYNAHLSGAMPNELNALELRDV